MDQESLENEKSKTFRASRYSILMSRHSTQGQGFGVYKGDLLVCSETLHADLPAVLDSQASPYDGDMRNQYLGIGDPVEY